MAIDTINNCTVS